MLNMPKKTPSACALAATLSQCTAELTRSDLEHRTVIQIRNDKSRSSGSLLGLEAKLVTNGIAQPLLATQVPFRGLHADVPEQELDLLEFSTGQVTQAGASATEIVGRDIRQPAAGRILLDHSPDNLGTEAIRRYPPPLLMARNTAPSVTPASINQTRTASATQSGIGTVLT